MVEIIDNSRSYEKLAALTLSLAMVLLIVSVDITAKRSANTDQDSLPVAIEPIAVFPDFASITDVDVKKQQFFDYIQPFVHQENKKILELREQVINAAQSSQQGAELSDIELNRLTSIARSFELDTEATSPVDWLAELLLRVDAIPTSLVLAQAANESAWGTSRFALEGNNVFGQWCYDLGCGIVPSQRAEGATHEVRSFSSVEQAVQSYFRNINTHPSYDYLRDLRWQMRQQDMDLNAVVLAYGLGKYSERGTHYIDELQTIINQNDLQSRDNS